MYLNVNDPVSLTDNTPQPVGNAAQVQCPNDFFVPGFSVQDKQPWFLCLVSPQHSAYIATINQGTIGTLSSIEAAVRPTLEVDSGQVAVSATRATLDVDRCVVAVT